MALSAWRTLRLTTAKFFADDMPTYAAALAYRTLFALIPFLVFLIALLGFLDVPELFDWMRAQAAYMLPPIAVDQVNGILAEVQQPRGGILSLGIALTVWSASAGVLGTINALNVAYNVRERRPAWKRFLVSVTYTVGLALMLLFAAAMMVTGPRLLEWLARYVGLGAVFVAVWTWARWPAAIALLLAVIAIIYYAAPNTKAPFRLFTPGALLAVAVWIGASMGFRLYVENLGNYSEAYGSMGAIIMLLFYFFLSSAVLLFGAELNSVIEQEVSKRPQ